jgi:IS605 OrfB family transposase
LPLIDGQKASVLRTMGAYTRAFEIAAQWGYQNRNANKFAVHHGVYYTIRQEVPELPSALVLTAKDTACEALKLAKLRTLPHRRTYAAMRYMRREASVRIPKGTVSLGSVDGRIKTTCYFPPAFDRYAQWEVRASIIMYERKSKEFYIGVMVKKEAPPMREEDDILGIDRGINKVAVCSNNIFFDSKRINSVRGRYAKNRAELQAKGTRSAKRKLKEMSGREKRFVACESHRITKQIVNMNYSVFALEDLSHITRQRWVTKSLKNKLHRWPYYQFEEFLKYKTEEGGKQVVFIDPTCTSQQCSRCGHIDKENRVRGWFKCLKCGHQLDADLNASRNIARFGKIETGRPHANRPNATDDEEGHSGAQSKYSESSCKPLQMLSDQTHPHKGAVGTRADVQVAVGAWAQTQGAVGPSRHSGNHEQKRLGGR